MAAEMGSARFSPPPQNGDIVFVSLGLAILDELHLSDGAVVMDLAGGSGLYSTAGARMSTEAASDSSQVGCVILAGADFPESVEDTLRSWNVKLLMVRDPTRLSTRCRLEYRGENFSERLFAFTSYPLQPTPFDLEGTPLLRSKAFHLLATPDELTTAVAQLSQACAKDVMNFEPLLVWEPTPTSCILDNCEAHRKAAKLVDVYSPNHFEFLSIFKPGGGPPPPVLDQKEIEHLALGLLQSGVGRDGNGTVVIRCGESGSLVASRSFPARWFPAFHNTSSGMVTDATGAGNAFLGGFTVRLSETVDLEEAAVAGTVAASFAIEQIGLPRRSIVGEREMWNGEEFSSRARNYRGKHLDAQL